METQARLAKEIAMDQEKLDLERDKLETDTGLEIMKMEAAADSQSNTEAMTVLRENIVSAREAMKEQSSEKIARQNARQNEKKTDQDQ